MISLAKQGIKYQLKTLNQHLTNHTKSIKCLMVYLLLFLIYFVNIY